MRPGEHLGEVFVVLPDPVPGGTLVIADAAALQGQLARHLDDEDAKPCACTAVLEFIVSSTLRRGPLSGEPVIWEVC